MKTAITIITLAAIAAWHYSQQAYKTGYMDGYNKHIQTYLPAPGLSKGPMPGLIEKEQG